MKILVSELRRLIREETKRILSEGHYVWTATKKSGGKPGRSVTGETQTFETEADALEWSQEQRQTTGDVYIVDKEYVPTPDSGK